MGIDYIGHQLVSLWQKSHRLFTQQSYHFYGTQLRGFDAETLQTALAQKPIKQHGLTRLPKLPIDTVIPRMPPVIEELQQCCG